MNLKSQIIILDFGSQYTHLIARRIRQMGVLAHIESPSISAKYLKGASGIILSGGPQSVHDDTAIKYDKKIFDLKIPILGFCYGHQLIAQHFGGTVKPGKVKEYGLAKFKVRSLGKLGTSILFDDMSPTQQVWMSHGDSVKNLPKGFEVAGETSDCDVAAMSNAQKNIYSLQFHPEVTHTTNGIKIINNFVFKISKCKKDWSMAKHWKQLQVDIKQKVGKRNVFLLVSGGVDSTVAFAMLEKILGKKRVFGLHIDNGAMRKNESKWVQRELSKAGFDDLVVVDATEKFLKSVEGMTEPEAKRKAFGKTFLEVKDEIMKAHKLNPVEWMLGQGTIYPDTIESGGTKHADKIKTHHNRVDEILKLMKLGKIVEPLSELYKDEVREIGKILKLPKVLLDRHPFPGPGLSIRALCNEGCRGEPACSPNTKYSGSNQKGCSSQKGRHMGLPLQRLQKIVGSNLQSAILPIKSVGVQGDNRTYRHPAVISGNVSWKKLEELSVKIINQISEINRVVYLVSDQPKARSRDRASVSNVKLKKSFLTKDRLDLLREVDDVVLKTMRKNKIYKNIWQFPVILAPLSIDGGETVILRPVISQEAMTVNFYPMDKKILKQLVKDIMAIDGIDMVLYDVTNKPPGTIEWE